MKLTNILIKDKNYQDFLKDQDYIFELSRKIDVQPRIICHHKPTNTCQEKLELLQERFPEQAWSLDRIIKTIFADVDDKLVGFVLPEMGQRVTEDLVKSAYQQAGIDGDYFKPSVNEWYIPPGMEIGTCTPFVLEDGMKFVDYIFIQNKEEIDSLNTDISIGGTGKEAHKLSMHIPYGAIYDILKEKISEKVYRFDY